MRLYRIRGRGIPLSSRMVLPKRNKSGGAHRKLSTGVINEAKQRKVMPMSGAPMANLGKLRPIRFRL